MSTFDETDRVAIAALADLLIPASSEMPSASQVDVQGKWLDRAVAARPELVDLLRPAIDAVRSSSPDEALVTLKQDDPDAVETFFGTVAACYYMHPGVRKRIGYAGQDPVPIADGEAEYYLSDDLLGPVIERGPIYRDAN